MRRNTTRRTHRRVRWTPIELGLIALAALLIVGAAGTEAYRWVNPPGAPAAPRLQEEATATVESATELPTVEAATATDALTAEPTATEPATAEPTATEPATAEPTEQPPAATATAELPSPEPPTATTAPPTITPTPTLLIIDPPLTLNKSATVTSARAGEQFTYILDVVTSSEQARTVEVRDTIDTQLEVIEAGSPNGTCNKTNLVTCIVTTTKAQPARIVINVRVRQDVAPGTSLVSQALGRDDIRFTAASERIVVTVPGSVVQGVPASDQAAIASPTSAPAQPRPSEPDQAEQPSQPEESPQTVAEAPSPAVPTATVESAPQVVAAADTGQSAQATAASSGSVQRPTPGLPPTLAPVAPGGNGQPSSPTNSSATLPNTSATVPAFGLGVGLLGFALTLHGARRVRRADARLAAEGAALRDLGPLVEDSAGFQQATVAEIERMRQQSDDMVALIESVKQ